MSRGEEQREHHGLEEVEEDNDLEAEELLKSAAGLEDWFEALVEAEDSYDGKDSRDRSNDSNL